MNIFDNFLNNVTRHKFLFDNFPKQLDQFEIIIIGILWIWASQDKYKKANKQLPKKSHL